MVRRLLLPEIVSYLGAFALWSLINSKDSGLCLCVPIRDPPNGANLSGANLSGAISVDLTGTTGIPLNCP